MDAAYFARANCDATARSGRTLVIGPRGDSRSGGFHVVGRMLRWRCGDPRCSAGRTSCADCSMPRSSLLGELGAAVRAETFALRELHLVLECVRYGLSPNPSACRACHA